MYPSHPYTCHLVLIIGLNPPGMLSPSPISGRRDFNSPGSALWTWQQVSLWLPSLVLKANLTSHWALVAPQIPLQEPTFLACSMNSETCFVLASPPPLLHSKEHTPGPALHSLPSLSNTTWSPFHISTLIFPTFAFYSCVIFQRVAVYHLLNQSTINTYLIVSRLILLTNGTTENLKSLSFSTFSGVSLGWFPRSEITGFKHKWICNFNGYD